MKKIMLAAAVAVCLSCKTQQNSRRDHLVTLDTNYGTLHMVLFDETPKHKANFIKLANSKFYDGLLFHRIIEDFMIQGGDPESRNAPAGKDLGSGGGSVPQIPFEFTPKHIHVKGALAAARDNNPEKKSSGCQFYIVDGKPRQNEELTLISQRNKMNYTAAQRAAYAIVGGTPHLDNGYTVFGTVIDNFSLIDTLAAKPRNAKDRPLKDIRIEKMRAKAMSKKRITKLYGYKFE